MEKQDLVFMREQLELGDTRILARTAQTLGGDKLDNLSGRFPGGGSTPSTPKLNTPGM